MVEGKECILAYKWPPHIPPVLLQMNPHWWKEEGTLCPTPLPRALLFHMPWILTGSLFPSRLLQDPLIPAVAGHTLTARRGSSLLLIGGYSPENGFNKKLLEYNVVSESWRAGSQAGTPPTGRGSFRPSEGPWG